VLGAEAVGSGVKPVCRWSYIPVACYVVTVSVNVEKRTDPPGESDHVLEAWELKERIRRSEGVLRQRRGFFTDAYRRSTTHLVVEDDAVIAFASVRRDGYVLFLAVDPDHRGRGLAERLIAGVAEEHQSVSCHARTTNDRALGFYEHIGFEVKRRIDSYYEDGGDAYYLTLGAGSLRERLSDFVRR
jgi:Acetyltransferases